MKKHRPWRLSSATLVRLLSEIYVEAALSISARINLVYVPFFIIGELSVRMQQAERVKLVGIALFKRSIGSLMECLKENLEFEKWMYETARESYEQSRIGKAIKYTLPLMPRLGRYVNEGRFCIDKKLVENDVRPVDLGRKTSCSAGITMMLSYTLWSVYSVTRKKTDRIKAGTDLPASFSGACSFTCKTNALSFNVFRSMFVRKHSLNPVFAA